MEEDQKSQVPISADKNCQAENIKGSLKPKKDMQSEKPAIKSRNKKSISSNQNCQAENIKGSLKPKKDMQSEKPAIKSRNKKSIGSNQNCLAESIRRPRKPSSVMQSVTNTEERWSAKPEIRRLCRDGNCQSTRCYQNTSPKETKV